MFVKIRYLSNRPELKTERRARWVPVPDNVTVKEQVNKKSPQ